MSRASFGRLVVVLAATVGVAACGADAVSPLPVQPPGPTRSTPTPSATPESPSRPPPPPTSGRPAAAPPAPTRTRGTPRTTPPPTDATPACQGAVRYDLPLADTEIELLKSLCFATGAVLRIQGIGPGLGHRGPPGAGLPAATRRAWWTSASSAPAPSPSRFPRRIGSTPSPWWCRSTPTPASRVSTKSGPLSTGGAICTYTRARRAGCRPADSTMPGRPRSQRYVTTVHSTPACRVVRAGVGVQSPCVRSARNPAGVVRAAGGGEADEGAGQSGVGRPAGRGSSDITNAGSGSPSASY